MLYLGKQIIPFNLTSFFVPSVFYMRCVNGDGPVSAGTSWASDTFKGLIKCWISFSNFQSLRALLAICSYVKSVHFNAVFSAPWDHAVLAWGQHFHVHTICHHVVTYVMASQQCTAFQCHAVLRCSAMSDHCGNHTQNLLKQTNRREKLGLKAVN